jgi:hypothetical protein
MKFIYSLVIVISLSYNVFGQKTNSIGIDIRGDNTFNSTNDLDYSTIKTYKSAIKINFGLLYERDLSKRSAIETEILFKQFETNHSYLVPTGTNFSTRVGLDGRESFVGLQCLYKRKIGTLNFSIGPSIDYFLHWKSEQPNNGYTIFTQDQLPSFWFPKKLTFGIFANIGYPYHLNNRLTLKPQLSYYHNISFKQEIIGISVQTKYLF